MLLLSESIMLQSTTTTMLSATNTFLVTMLSTIIIWYMLSTSSSMFTVFNSLHSTATIIYSSCPSCPCRKRVTLGKRVKRTPSGTQLHCQPCPSSLSATGGSNSSTIDDQIITDESFVNGDTTADFDPFILKSSKIDNQPIRRTKRFGV